MKKIIDGKTYNTETAIRMGRYYNGFSSNDFRNIDECLYLTKKGTFFLAGEGGPMTKYAQQYGDSSGSGDGMEILTKAEALEWRERHDIDTNIIEKYFEIDEG